MDHLTENEMHSDCHLNALRMPRNRITAHLCGALSCLATLGLVGIPASAAALDGRLASGRTLVIQPAKHINGPDHGHHRPAAEAAPTSGLNRWVKKTLARVPLRPVRIGETPRRPDDPEPGVGVVLRLPF